MQQIYFIRRTSDVVLNNAGVPHPYQPKPALAGPDVHYSIPDYTESTAAEQQRVFLLKLRQLLFSVWVSLSIITRVELKYTDT